MGNAASKDPAAAAAAAGHYGRPSYSAALSRREVYAPPQLATAGLGPAGQQPPRFEIISPASDLSNPSNLDRLKRSRQYERARTRQQTPVRERRRTSKVMTARNGTGRLVTNQRSAALPAPDGFYFGPTVAAPLAGAVPLPPPEANKENFAMRKNAATREPAHLAALVYRAKQALQGCLQQTHTAVAAGGDFERHRPRHHHERLSSVPPSIEVQPMTEPVSEIRHPAPLRRTAHQNRRSSTSNETGEDEDLLYEQEHSELIQFDAAQPNYLGVMRNPYLHSEDNYFRSLARPSDAGPPPQQSEKHELMEDEITAPSSPVMQLFAGSEPEQADRQSSAIENHHDYWLACVLQISATHKRAYMEERKQRKRSLESTTVASESSADTARHRRLRGSSTSTGPANAAPDARRMSAEEFRHSVEALVQQQIDAQLAAQVEHQLRIRSSDENQVSHAALGSQEPTTVTTSSDDTRAQKERQFFQRKMLQRSNSMPLVTRNEGVDVAKTGASRVGRSKSHESAARKRSASVPSRRLSTTTMANEAAPSNNELPALLRLAGWEPSAVAAPIFKKEKKPVVVKDPVDNFPALLKLAGWQESSGPRKRRRSRLSIQSALPRLQRNKRLTLTLANRTNRQSEPIPATKPLPGASKSRRILTVETAPEGRRSTSIRAFNSAQTSRFDQYSAQATVSSHGFNETQVSTSTFTVGAAPKPFGLTTATMLQQTYGISAATSALNHDLGTISEDYINLEAQAVLVAKTSRVSGVYGSDRDSHSFGRLLGSPAVSYCSLDSQRSPIFGSPVPLVSGQATSNAEFLFASAGKADHYPGSDRNTSDCNISTVESLKRLSGASYPAQPVSIPSSKSTGSAAPSQDQSDRRVRFSEVIDMKSPFRELPTQSYGTVYVHPEIETRMSDLTDNGEYTRPRVSDPPQIEPIPEDLPEEEGLEEKVLTQEEVIEPVTEDSLIKLDNAGAKDIAEPVKRWSYTVGVGVTPMRKGTDTSNATNSPMLRFQEARSKFAGSSSVPHKTPPVKRASPVKRIVGGSIVSARIAAILHEREKSQGQIVTNKMWRPTPKNFSVNESVVDNYSISKSESPDSNIAATVANEERNKQVNHFQKAASPSNSEKSSDPFGRITHSKTFDEDSVSHEEPNTNTTRHPMEVCDDSDEKDEDAFAELLKEEQDDYTLSGTTVSTVQNEGRDYGAATAALLNSFASTQTQRVSNCRNSVASSSSSTASDARPRKRLSFASSADSTATSTVFSNPAITSLTFRDEAPVRPAEQKDHRQVPGTLVLSPMQRTPMQARKWRVLAAAAQEKDRKAIGARRGSSLRERHPNVAA